MSSFHFKPTTMANEILYTEQDIVYRTAREGQVGKTITRQDRVVHRPTFVRGEFPVKMCPYPTNLAIASRSCMPDARAMGIHDLRGTDGVWAGAIIADQSQLRRGQYSGMEPVALSSFADSLMASIIVNDTRVDRTLITLIDKGLYDRVGADEIRNVPEERAMRYTAVCTSMMTDRVENLEFFREEVGKRTTTMEVVVDGLLAKQETLHNKVCVRVRPALF
jgi:hypothetical protein